MNEETKVGHLVGIVHTNGINVNDVVHLGRRKLVGVMAIFGHITELPHTFVG